MTPKLYKITLLLILISGIVQIYLILERHFQPQISVGSSVPFVSTTSIKYVSYYLSALPLINYGVANPNITQSNINQTICNPHWSTKSIRPPVSYTNKLKAQQIKDLGLYDTSMSDYEEDHIISLELGGSPTDPKNLWPEPYILTINGENLGARIKDKVENYLHDQVCNGNISLKDAQDQISTNWVNVLHSMQ